MWKMAISWPFWFFYRPLLSLSKNCLLVTCITNLRRILVKMLKLSRLQGQIIDVKWDKSTLDNSPPPNYDKESKDECHHVNNNPRYKWYVKPAAFQVIAPTRSNYGRKINVKNRNKSTILIFLPAIIELVQELLISNMHNKLEEDTCENVEVIVPTRSNYWRKMRKIAINRPFWIFFQPLLNLSKNYLLVTCITNLKRICEKLFKLSRPQGQIIDIKWEKSQ